MIDAVSALNKSFFQISGSIFVVFNQKNLHIFNCMSLSALQHYSMVMLLNARETKLSPVQAGWISQKPLYTKPHHISGSCIACGTRHHQPR